jgi:hypothetical protein
MEIKFIITNNTAILCTKINYFKIVSSFDNQYYIISAILERGDKNLFPSSTETFNNVVPLIENIKDRDTAYKILLKIITTLHESDVYIEEIKEEYNI